MRNLRNKGAVSVGILDAENERLRALNEELVAALMRICRFAASCDATDDEWDEAIDYGLTAIAKAKSGT